MSTWFKLSPSFKLQNAKIKWKEKSVFFIYFFHTRAEVSVCTAAFASLCVSTPQLAPLCPIKTTSSGHSSGQSKVCGWAHQVTANTSANSCFGAAAKRDGVLAASPVKTSCCADRRISCSQLLRYPSGQGARFAGNKSASKCFLQGRLQRVLP